MALMWQQMGNTQLEQLPWIVQTLERSTFQRFNAVRADTR
jgi:hypothetical protein